MQHVDEGQMHAFLDGELDHGEMDLRAVERHFAECPSCASRLVEVRQLRERGRILLEGNIAFPVSQPPFEDVLARARGTTSARGSRRWRMTSLAWAASVTVALGAGWLARGLLVDNEMGEVATVSESPIAESVLDRSAPAAETGSTEVTDVEELALSTSPKIGTTTNPVPAQPESAPPSAVRQEAVAADDFAGEGSIASGQLQSAAPPPPARAVSPPVVAAAGGVAVGAASSAAPEQRSVPLESVVASGMAARTRAATPFSPIAAGDAADGVGTWAAIDRVRAEDILRGPMLMVPDLPIVGIASGRLNGWPVVRIRHDLGDGRILTLVERAMGAGDPGADPTPAFETAWETAEGSQVVVGRGRVTLTASGPLSSVELQRLLARVR